MGMRSRVDDPRPFLQEKPHKSKGNKRDSQNFKTQDKDKTFKSTTTNTHTHNQSINVVFICAKNSFPLNVSKLPSTFRSARWCCSCFWHWGFGWWLWRVWFHWRRWLFWWDLALHGHSRHRGEHREWLRKQGNNGAVNRPNRKWGCRPDPRHHLPWLKRC